MVECSTVFTYSERIFGNNIKVIGNIDIKSKKIIFIFEENSTFKMELSYDREKDGIDDLVVKFNRCVEFLQLDYLEIALKMLESVREEFDLDTYLKVKVKMTIKSPLKVLIEAMIIKTEQSVKQKR